MRKIIILLLSIFVLQVNCLAYDYGYSYKEQEIKEQQIKEQQIKEQQIPNWMQGEEKLKKGNPDEFIRLYEKRRIDGNDIPLDITNFANNNSCFKVMKSYHWSSPIYNYGNVYMCGTNGKIQYIVEKNGNIKFANWFLKRKFNISVYE